MRKLIASINMTFDGFCDHTAVIADEELHHNTNELLKKKARPVKAEWALQFNIQRCPATKSAVENIKWFYGKCFLSGRKQKFGRDERLYAAGITHCITGI